MDMPEAERTRTRSSPQPLSVRNGHRSTLRPRRASLCLATTPALCSQEMTVVQ